MKKMSVREFRANFHTLTEPVEVYSYLKLKGTYTPDVEDEFKDVPKWKRAIYSDEELKRNRKK